MRILNGGLQSWIDEGFEESIEETPKRPVYGFGAPIPGQAFIAVDIEEAKEILASLDKNLVSIRSWTEYIGDVSGYNYIEKKGRIPGSVFGNCRSNAYHMPNLGKDTLHSSIIQGLSSATKSISSMFFYEECGSKLFEEITTLPFLDTIGLRSHLSPLRATTAWLPF